MTLTGDWERRQIAIHFTMLAMRRFVCGTCASRGRLLSMTKLRGKEVRGASQEKLKIEAEPPENGTKNWIGPPDPISNIRPIRFQIHSDETITEQNFRHQQALTIRWNHDFWQRHNAKFFKEKEDFVEKVKQKEGRKASSEELSQFYKQFLNENRHLHLKYNRDWYKKNISLLWPAMQVAMIRTIRRLTSM